MAIVEPEMVTLLPKLFVLIKQKSTGVLYIRTDKNESARIALDQGKIVYCCFRHLHGLQALVPLKKIQLCSLHFSKECLPDFSDKKDRLPPSAEVLALLTGEDRLAINLKVEEQLLPFKNHLLEMMGPMAEHVWDKHQAKLANIQNNVELKRVLQHIAKDIPFDQERMEFLSLIERIVA